MQPDQIPTQPTTQLRRINMPLVISAIIMYLIVVVAIVWWQNQNRQKQFAPRDARIIELNKSIKDLQAKQ